jgi:hypothetical protein
VYTWGAFADGGTTFIFKSNDAGGTWTSSAEPSYLLSTGPDAFVIDPVMTSVMYTNTVLDGVIRSTDAGLTWTQLTIPKPAGSPLGSTSLQPSISRVVTDPNSAAVVYAVGPGNNSQGGRGYLQGPVASAHR